MNPKIVDFSKIKIEIIPVNCLRIKIEELWPIHFTIFKKNNYYCFRSSYYNKPLLEYLELNEYIILDETYHVIPKYRLYKILPKLLLEVL